jgi:transposase-like protein
VRKRQRRFEGFDDKIVAMYARGMTTREIEAQLPELYGASVGRDSVSRVTEGCWTTPGSGSRGRSRRSTRSST